MSSDDASSEEDRLDLQLLNQRLTRIGSRSTISSGCSTDNQVWPLQLSTTSVDNYIFGESIGHGSYAEVREGLDCRTLERRAIKIVNKDYLSRQAPDAWANQLQEIKLLRRFRHQNVISLKECIFKGSKVYLVLEYCTFALNNLLAEQINHCLDPALARLLFQQLCRGLEYLHSIGVVHRDIKPHNMLITNCGVLKIIDYGVSQILSMWSLESRCANYEGSPLFQAPEVVCGQQEYDGLKVDVWSAGVTLYQMLFGQCPFHDESLLGLYDKILGQPVSFPSNVKLACHQVVYDLLGRMLDKLASRRASVSEVLSHPWLAYQCPMMASGEHSELVASLLPKQCVDQALDSEATGPKLRDVYRSMTVLPYLHSHHFPHERARVVSRPQTPSVNNAEDILSPLNRSPNATPAEDRANPHEILGQDDVQWGTAEQYNLMKIPLIRANRIKYEHQRQRRKRRQGNQGAGFDKRH